MSRLTRTLLALATAALLTVCAGAPRVGVNHCSTLLLGKKTSDTVDLPMRTTGSHAYIYVPDQCATQKKRLVGEEVTVCDTTGFFSPSAIPFGAGSFSPLAINCAPENQPCYELLTVTITQYCEPQIQINRNSITMNDVTYEV